MCLAIATRVGSILYALILVESSPSFVHPQNEGHQRNGHFKSKGFQLLGKPAPEDKRESLARKA